jgi:hypothetical protein
VTQTGPVNEGNSFNFTVTTSGIACRLGQRPGAELHDQRSGPCAHPGCGAPGTVVLDNNGLAVVTVHTLADLIGTGSTTVTINVGNDAPVNVTINETAAQTVTPDNLNFAEGGSVVFTVVTSGIAGSAVAGQVENWILSGPGSTQVNGPLSGTVTLDQNGVATITVHTSVDGLNAPLAAKDLTITLLSGSTPVASGLAHITQGSQTVSAPAAVTEGSAFSFDVTTTGVAPGSVAGRVETIDHWRGIEYIPVAERSGQLTLDADGKATITVSTLTISMRSAKRRSSSMGNDPQITVNILRRRSRPSPTMTLTIRSTRPGVTFTINTFGVDPASVAGQSSADVDRHRHRHRRRHQPDHRQRAERHRGPRQWPCGGHGRDRLRSSMARSTRKSDLPSQ